jgi:hypothetical protein
MVMVEYIGTVHRFMLFFRYMIMLLVLGMGTRLSAQNLQFGRTKLIDSKTDTVPVGKIWKIENFTYSKSLANCPTGGSVVNITDSIVLNGNKMAVRAQRFSGVDDLRPWGTSLAPEYLLWEQRTPLWLPAGTTLSAGRGVLYISVLEFKEAP